MLQENPVLRRALFTVAVLALVAYGWFAVQVYRAQESPESFAAWDGAYAWIVGPKAADLTDAAEARMREGVAALRNSELRGPERLAAYRSSFETAEQLLIRSLRANPAQAEALTDLAATRFELAATAKGEAEVQVFSWLDLRTTLEQQLPQGECTAFDGAVRAFTKQYFSH